MAGRSCDLLIFHNRLLWQTVSHFAHKSSAMQIVRHGGFFWLNHIAKSVVNCITPEMVECAGLKPCWKEMFVDSK